MAYEIDHEWMRDALVDGICRLDLRHSKLFIDKYIPQDSYKEGGLRYAVDQLHDDFLRSILFELIKYYKEVKDETCNGQDSVG